MRVLILTCSHGSGHRVIAQTLEAKYKEYGCDVEVFDVFNEYNRLLNVTMEKLYLLSYKPFIDKIYGFLYYLTAKDVDKSLDSTFYKLFKDIVVNVISGFKPDLIVNTYNHRTVALNKAAYPDIPIVNVVTEFTLPSFWIHENVDKYYLASERTKEILMELGEDEDKAKVTGIPVREDFSVKYDKEALFEKYNLDKEKKTLIIFAGTFGVLKNLTKICSGIEKINGLQTIVVCGLNKKLYKKLKRKDYKNIQIMRYISDIQEIYDVADFMITKPGGTVLSEAVRKCVPVILYDPVPGQELENAEIFQSIGAGIIASTTKEVLSEVIYLLDHPQALSRMKSALETLNYGDATETIVEDSLKLIKK